jgi:hypothetical protein
MQQVIHRVNFASARSERSARHRDRDKVIDEKRRKIANSVDEIDRDRINRR